MSAQYISLKRDRAPSADIEKAAKALADGALVVFPTETVYGLAASAANADSVVRLRAVKGRDKDKPFTVHIGRAADCETIVPDITPLGHRFIRKGWPGPLTLIFRVERPGDASAYRRLSPEGAAAVYRNNTVGVRFPDHPVAEQLLASSNAPIIAASANKAGGRPPVEASELVEVLGEDVDYVIDAGPTRYRKSSTIVALNGDGYRLVREGVWDERTVRKFATATILFVCTGNTCRSPMAEGICRKILAEQFKCAIDELAVRGVVVQSAGTLGYSGGHASPEAVQICKTRGVDISAHRSRGLSPELVHPADYIFVMAAHQLEAVRAVAPADAQKAVLLNADGDIADPIGGTIADYETAADSITAALERRLKEIVL